MSPRTPASPVERHCDVAVVGGSAAGLAAALQLGRQRRSVIVVDAGDPRNAPAEHLHSYLGFDGRPPSELVAAGREEVRRYGGEVVSGRAEHVTRIDGRHLRVELVGGHSIVARRVVAATGIVDALPDIEGLASQWGRGVIHCPFCHGYELRDQRIAAIVSQPRGVHPLPLFRQLTSQLTVILHDAVDLDRGELDLLEAIGVELIEQRARRVVDQGGRVAGVELEDGRTIDADAIAVLPEFRARIEAFEPLGVRTVPHPSGLGDIVEVDASGETSVPGLFAVGNVTDPGQQLLQAAAAGSQVGGVIAWGLAHEDLVTGSRPSANESDWDHRYGSEQMWSGRPNGTLVDQVEGLPPGRALDVGAGEGGDAIWLAEQGWSVTASDISRRALDRVAAEVAARGLEVECRHVDANDVDPFPPSTFDLVSAQYASIPRTPDDRAVHSLLRAVAPGGRLLVVGHDLEPMRTPVDTATQSRPFDPDAYVRVEDVAAVLEESPGWLVELHERRPRPPGAASSHHVDDVVLRARRLT